MSTPKLQFVTTEVEGWCDPVSGVCALPDAGVQPDQAAVRTDERPAPDAETTQRPGKL